MSKAAFPVIDPTANVISLVQANKVAADELNAMRDRYIEARIDTVRESLRWMERLSDVHQRHDYALHKAEAGRLDALRQNDREDVKVLAAQTAAKADALQNQLSVTATTLQSQVLTTAETLAKTIAADQSEQNKRLSAIERQQAEGMGKATVESPMMAELVAETKALRLAMAGTIGQTQGAKETKVEQRDNSKYIIAVIGLLLAILAFVAGRGGLH